eukprot:TRINITY_DN37502_c0_g1_i1.p1 TRINITY_DN37502_c0_g1~~TRINITY_DN37502_c0_g1_i1.p1  ORF type:complete len:285 (-),score=22.35 TRINITY_DN37502_c0_g1_i1:224-1078(-)
MPAVRGATAGSTSQSTSRSTGRSSVHERVRSLVARMQWPVDREYLIETLGRQKESVLAAVSQHGPALEFASEALRRERVVVLQAVQQNCVALQFAAPTLRADRELQAIAASMEVREANGRAFSARPTSEQRTNALWSEGLSYAGEDGNRVWGPEAVQRDREFMRASMHMIRDAAFLSRDKASPAATARSSTAPVPSVRGDWLAERPGFTFNYGAPMRSQVERAWRHPTSAVKYETTAEISGIGSIPTASLLSRHERGAKATERLFRREKVRRPRMFCDKHAIAG